MRKSGSGEDFRVSHQRTVPGGGTWPAVPSGPCGTVREEGGLGGGVGCGSTRAALPGPLSPFLQTHCLKGS